LLTSRRSPHPDRLSAPSSAIAEKFLDLIMV
jgi:hypothetical protein